MAVVISPKQPSLSFPHDILHGSQDHSPYPSMEQSTNPKPSLPSISTLIQDVQKQAENAKEKSPSLEHQRKLSAGSHAQNTSPDRPSLVGSPRDPPPPTPPLPGTSSFDFPPRPSTGNTTPGASGHLHTSYFGHSPGSTNPEHYAHRSSYPPIPDSNSWPPSHSPKSQRRPSDETSQHGSHRGSQSSYPDPSEANSPYPGLSQQRPLPANFPPQVPPTSQQLPPIDPQMAPPYQHHHHTYPITNPPAYPQTTDRYVCPTCQKAFSRPSSLKIHTYSHTGEKPFKCKYEGCGKYFSVRSNMKRHEKGCHGGDTSSAGGNSPKS